MTNKKADTFDVIKAHAAARRREYFARGGTAKGWSLKTHKHAEKHTKASRSKRACRIRVVH